MTASHKSRLNPVAWACLVVGAVLTVVVTRLHGVSLGGQLRLGLAELVTIIAPGFVLSTWASRSTWLARISLAFAVGLPVQLLGWLLAVTTGFSWTTWAIALVVTLIVGTVLRKRVLAEFRGHKPLMPAWGSLALLVVWVTILAKFTTSWRGNPKSPVAWYQDLYWHIAIDASARHQIPMMDPQALSETLNYHWLSNAHVAALTLAGGLDLNSTAVITYGVPIFAATIGATIGLTQFLSRSIWCAVIAGILVAWAPTFVTDRSMIAGTTSNLILASPSHLLGLPVVVALTWTFTHLMRYRRQRWLSALPAVIGLLLIAPGVKISLLPVVLSGLILAMICTLVTRRGRLVMVGLTGLTGIILAATYPIFGGGGGGSALKILGSVKAHQTFRRSLDHLTSINYAAHLAILLMFAVLLAMNHLWWAIGLAGMRWRDPVAWLFIGMLGSGLGVVFVIHVPGESQQYFTRGIQPLGAVVAALGLWHLYRRARRTAGLRLLVASTVTLAALAVALGDYLSSSTRVNKLTGWAVAVPFLALTVAAVLIWLVGRSRSLVGALLATAVLAFSLGLPIAEATTPGRYAGFAPQKPTSRAKPVHALTNDELSAVAFVRNNTAITAVIATNVHCMPVKSKPNCDARGFWVAGLGQRQVLLGGWAYSGLARGVNGPKSRQMPYPDTQTFDLNEAAFKTPSTELMEQLRKRGVSYLFADRRAGAVSPKLGQFCKIVYANQTVTVCALG